MRALRDETSSRLPEMIQLLEELVAIESPSSHAEGVAAVAARLAGALEPLEMGVELVPVAGAGPLLRACPRGAPRPGRVMLLGHTDTVWPRGTLARRPPRLEGDFFFGPGSYDMKAGLVILVFALDAVRRRGVSSPVTVFLTPLEEVGDAPYQGLMEAEMRASSAVLCFEPAWPGGALKTERKGSGSFVLRVRGRAAHAGADFEKGRNAILELSRSVLRASALTDLSRGTTVSVGTIRGGIRPNVVPDCAEAEIDVRYRTRAEGERVERSLRSIAPEAPGTALEVAGGLHYPPLERTPGVRALYETAEGVGRGLGLVLSEVSTGGASEASFAGALGIPTLDGLGADGDGAHAEHEHVLVASLADRAALAAGLIERLGRGGSPAQGR